MRYLLYNPLSGKENQTKINAECYSVVANMPTELVDLTEVENLGRFLARLNIYDDIVIFGGDGSLNRIVNELERANVYNEIYYCPSGTGNDFARDVGMADAKEPFLIDNYIKKLPTVTVNGKQSKFINGVGFGIDGYCCEVGDLLKSKHQIPNYAAIAIKGLLFHFKPTNAIIEVDGHKYDFKKVWIAPTMFGRYYGGGMMPTPMQNRNAPDKKVSLMVFHGTGKLRTLMIFPSIFNGRHVKKEKNVTILEGKNISVTFDCPVSLQIDGETVLNVTHYTVEI